MNRRGAETQSGEQQTIASSAPLRLCGENVWLIWQLADSAFPTGGFAHSGGLEAAYQHRALRGGHELAAYLRVALGQLTHASLPFVHAAFFGERSFFEVDSSCDAFLSSHVANRASRLQGQALLATCERTFASEPLSQFRDEVIGGACSMHGAPVFGRVAKLMGLDSEATARLFIFTQLRGWISAAVRLNIVGPLEGQRVQHGLAGEAERCAARFGQVGLGDVAQAAPLLDLWQGTQDRLYSRLFQT
ncbi:MAG TPA: urease accessory UreF family protein [Candidatus Acidoferrum sp.]|nr:urease accessory UreF family protein [Candidatus Acidoferrum sp.]